MTGARQALSHTLRTPSRPVRSLGRPRSFSSSRALSSRRYDAASAASTTAPTLAALPLSPLSPAIRSTCGERRGFAIARNPRLLRSSRALRGRQSACDGLPWTSWTRCSAHSTPRSRSSSTRSPRPVSASTRQTRACRPRGARDGDSSLSSRTSSGRDSRRTTSPGSNSSSHSQQPRPLPCSGRPRRPHSPPRTSRLPTSRTPFLPSRTPASTRTNCHLSARSASALPALPRNSTSPRLPSPRYLHSSTLSPYSLSGNNSRLHKANSAEGTASTGRPFPPSPHHSHPLPHLLRRQYRNLDKPSSTHLMTRPRRSSSPTSRLRPIPLHLTPLPRHLAPSPTHTALLSPLLLPLFRHPRLVAVEHVLPLPLLGQPRPSMPRLPHRPPPSTRGRAKRAPRSSTSSSPGSTRSDGPSRPSSPRSLTCPPPPPHPHRAIQMRHSQLNTNGGWKTSFPLTNRSPSPRALPPHQASQTRSSSCAKRNGGGRSSVARRSARRVRTRSCGCGRTWAGWGGSGRETWRTL